jgi:hypothetical protein
MIQIDASTSTSRRPPRDPNAAREALALLWEASDLACGKSLKALLPTLIPALETHGHWRWCDDVKHHLSGMSASTIDRLLRPYRSHRVAKGGSRLGKSSDLSPAARRARLGEHPGNLELQLTVHRGAREPDGCLGTLSLIDAATGWIDCVPLANLDPAHLVERLERACGALPFEPRELIVGPDMAFADPLLSRHCEARSLALVRCAARSSRAPRAGGLVARLVGTGRLEGPPALEALERLYPAVTLYVNAFRCFFTRTAARGARRYRLSEAPGRRLLAHPDLSDAQRAGLRARLERLDPIAMLRDIRGRRSHVLLLAAGFVAVPRVGEPKPARAWRTHEDPFAPVYDTLKAWIRSDPTQTGTYLFERLRREFPGKYGEGQLRSLQRRLQDLRE